MQEIDLKVQAQKVFQNYFVNAINYLDGDEFDEEFVDKIEKHLDVENKNDLRRMIVAYIGTVERKKPFEVSNSPYYKAVLKAMEEDPNLKTMESPKISNSAPVIDTDLFCNGPNEAVVTALQQLESDAGFNPTSEDKIIELVDNLSCGTLEERYSATIFFIAETGNISDFAEYVIENFSEEEI